MELLTNKEEATRLPPECFMVQAKKELKTGKVKMEATETQGVMIFG